MITRAKKFWTIAATLSFALTLAACGGDDGGSPPPPPPPRDSTPPTVSSTAPANNASGVALNTAVTANFSEQMDSATITTATFTLKDATNNPVTGAVSYSGTTATFTPSGNLAPSTTYTATITTGAKDLAGNALTTNYSWAFVTIVPDTTPPTVTSTFPPAGASGVALGLVITATFSEPMDTATITSSTFMVKDSSNTPVMGTVVYAGLTATFTPTAPLIASTTYTVTITTDVKDLGGNALTSDIVWLFTTTATTPRAGSLDTSFGVGGVRLVPFGASAAEAWAIALQPDGKSLVGGYADVTGARKFALTRLDLNGALDPTFGSGGTVITTFATSDFDIIWGLAVQPDGKIIAAGGYSAFALARYNADGSLDTTFGSSGTVRTEIGVYPSVAYSVALQTDGKIIAGGQSVQATGVEFTLIRYNSDGSLDLSFGSGGISSTPVAGYRGTIRSILIQPDGKIVAAGYARVSGTYDFAFTRFNPDGSVDTSFGINGSTIISISTGDDTCFSVRLQSDGKIVAAGVAGIGTFAVVRLTSQGSLDSSFGASGMVTTDFGSQSAAYGLAVQTDGRLIAAGFAQGFALARYNTDGSLDTTFGSGGKVTTTAGGLLVGSFTVAIQGDGKIVAAGLAVGAGNFPVARFWP
jgi:uncharacterized delta-60 repeat protein